jgi:hypothetical protein
MSYAIPTNELTLSDIKTYKERCLAAGIARAKAKGIAASDEELVWREMLPAFDLGALVLAGSGWALNYYVTPAAAGAGAWASLYGLAAALDPLLPVGRVAVFYKLYDASANPMATAVRFLLAAATTKANFFVQCLLDNKLEPEVWFSEPVVYDPQDTVNLDFYGRAATPAGGEELGFGCFIIERVGAVVS